MHTRDVEFEAVQILRKPAAFAVVFFVLSTALLSTAVGSAWVAAGVTDRFPEWKRAAFIVSFLTSTGLLAAGSVQLVRAAGFVRVERQAEFRRCLLQTLVAGTAFLCVQTCGLYALITQHSTDIATGLKHAAFVFILLHAVHILVALLFVVYVFLNALTDRYDHEYSWGVTFCGWFWHGLGVVWLAIVALLIVASSVAMAH